MDDYPKPYALDFELIRSEMDSLLRTIIYKIEREFPSQFRHISGAQEYVLICLMSGENTYRAIRYMSADVPPDPSRKPSYLLCVPPLNRTILDSLFNLVYMFEDFEPRLRWFQKAGWREQVEDYERLKATYGQYDSWQEYLAKIKRLTDRGAAEIGLSPAEQAEPTQIEKWPNPGKMPGFRIKAGQASQALNFLQYLNDWFYRELSQESHLSFFGAVRIGSFVLKEMLPDEAQSQVEAEGYERLKAVNVGRTLTLTLSLFSEVDAFFRLATNARLKYVWTFLGSHGPETKEVYDERYSALLNY